MRPSAGDRFSPPQEVPGADLRMVDVAANIATGGIKDGRRQYRIGRHWPSISNPVAY